MKTLELKIKFSNDDLSKMKEEEIQQFIIQQFTNQINREISEFLDSNQLLNVEEEDGDYVISGEIALCTPDELVTLGSCIGEAKEELIDAYEEDCFDIKVIDAIMSRLTDCLLNMINEKEN